MPEVTLGLPPAQIAPFVAARIGERQALRLMATGQRIGAAEGIRLGLVDEQVPAGGLDAAVQRWADQLQRAEPQALRATRAILRRSGPQGLNDTLDFAAQCFARSLRSGTAAEGLAALGDRRPPGWATPS
jgi:isohexenylglutaconyl-CoA hydratase